MFGASRVYAIYRTGRAYGEREVQGYVGGCCHQDPEVAMFSPWLRPNRIRPALLPRIPIFRQFDFSDLAGGRVRALFA